MNTTGVGPVHPKADINISRVKAGDKIIVSGNIATHGIAIMSVREGLEFETTIESDSTNLNHSIKSLLDEFGFKIHLLRDPTRGGVATVLTEIARDSALGIHLEQNALPEVTEKQDETHTIEHSTSNKTSPDAPVIIEFDPDL